MVARFWVRFASCRLVAVPPALLRTRVGSSQYFEMAVKPLPYAEGFRFLVPLKGGGYARGVIARMAPGGGTLLGYFFGPRVTKEAACFDKVKPEDAILRVRFGDLDLVRNKWPVFGSLDVWDRSEWPIPEFLWQCPLGRLPDHVVVYADDDITARRDEDRSSIPPGLAHDSLYGSGAVETRLSKLLPQLPIN